jgi:hypothetical protein
MLVLGFDSNSNREMSNDNWKMFFRFAHHVATKGRQKARGL